MDDFYIRKVLSGDIQAFRYFVKEYKDMAFSVAMSVVKEEFAAEEAVQDAFLKSFKALGSFNQQSKFSFLFYRIVLRDRYKLIVPHDANLPAPQPPELFDLAVDPHEQKNLATDKPELAKELRTQLDAWWKGD